MSESVSILSALSVEETVLWAGAIVVSAVAATIDVWKRKIPNLLTLPATISGFALHACFEIPALTTGWSKGWQFSLAGLAVGFGLTLVAAAISKGGGGDVKLAGALGAFLGPRIIFVLTGIAFITAFVWLASYFVLRDGVISTLRLLTATPKEKDNGRIAEAKLRSAGEVKLPLAPFFLVATLAVAVMARS